MADLNVALILKFVDQATAPARKAMQGVERLAAAGQRVGAAQIAQGRERIATARASTQGMLGEAAALAATGWAMTRALQPAIAFEAKMAEVGKVVDFEAGDGLEKLGRDIQALTTSGGLPMAADGIADIVAAAAQANLIDQALPDAEKRAELIAFADAAAKMGVAFDISAGEAGKAMAVWRSSLGLTQAEALSLGDAVNHLSNNLNASAGDLTNVIQRQGGVARAAGLASADVAALSAALLSGGSGAEVAATALKNFTGALTAGEAITDRQSGVLKKLGFDAVDLAKRMQVDARGAILDVVRALGELEKHEQGSSIRQLFGEEVTGSVTPLVTNIALLEDAFGLVANEADYAGAMTREYSVITETTASRLVVLQNWVNRVGTTLGVVLLPALRDIVEAMAPVLAAVTDYVEANPWVVRAVALSMASFLGLRVALLAARFGFAQVQLVLGLVQTLIGTAIWTVSKLAGVLLWLAKGALVVLGGALRGAGQAVMWLGRAFMIAGRFMLANPIIAVIAAIAAAAYVIYQNWDGIVAYFTEKIDRVRAAFDEGLLNGVLKLLAEFNPFLLSMDAAVGLFNYLTTGWDLSFLTDKLQAIGDIDLYEAGVAIVRSMWDGMLSIVGSMVSAISARIAAIVPPWMLRAWNWVMDGSTGEPAAGAAPGRALGGPVRAGQIYRWMEEGEEMFSPRVDGSVISSRELGALRAGGGGRTARSVTIGDIVINAAPGMSPEAVALAVRRELERLTARGAELHDGGIYAA